MLLTCEFSHCLQKKLYNIRRISEKEGKKKSEQFHAERNECRKLTTNMNLPGRLMQSFSPLHLQVLVLWSVSGQEASCSEQHLWRGEGVLHTIMGCLFGLGPA